MNRRSMFRNVLAAIGCSLLPLKAWARPAPMSAKDFGAISCGVRDDTAALQAALDCANSNYVHGNVIIGCSMRGIGVYEGVPRITISGNTVTNTSVKGITFRT